MVALQEPLAPRAFADLTGTWTGREAADSSQWTFPLQDDTEGLLTGTRSNRAPGSNTAFTGAFARPTVNVKPEGLLVEGTFTSTVNTDASRIYGGEVIYFAALLGGQHEPCPQQAMMAANPQLLTNP